MSKQPTHTFFAFSPGQAAAIRPLFDGMKKGETLMAQVFEDGLRMRVLNPDEIEKVRAIFGATTETLHKYGDDSRRHPTERGQP